MENKTPKQFIILFLTLTPLIVLVSFAHIMMSTEIAGIYIKILTLIGLFAIFGSSIYAHRRYKNDEFRFISEVFLVFACFFLFAELASILSAEFHITSLFYLSHTFWLIGYLPLLYACWKTLLIYSEYVDMKILIPITFFVFSVSIALLILIGLAVSTSPQFLLIEMKFIAIAYPYLDSLLLLVLFPLFYIYQKGRLAFYWTSITTGMLFFTIGDLSNALIFSYNIVATKNIPPSFFIMAYFYFSLGFGATAYIERKTAIMEPERLYDIRQIFLIYRSGLLITHIGKEKEVIDKQILSGMLSAIQNFIKDSFGRAIKKDDELKRIQYGEFEIHIEHGKYIFLAVALEGKGTERLHTRMRETITNIERIYGKILVSWDGNMEPFKKVPEHLSELF